MLNSELTLESEEEFEKKKAHAEEEKIDREKAKQKPGKIISKTGY